MQGRLILVALLCLLCQAPCFVLDNTTRPISSHTILPSSFTPPQTFRNINLVHTINLEKGFSRETLNIVIENVDRSAQDEYFLPLPSENINKIGALEVRNRNDLDAGLINVQLVKTDLKSENQFYRIRLPKPLAPKSQITIGVSFSYISALTPKPRSIPQLAEQFLEYQFSAYAPSSYITLKQKTEVKFPNTNIPNYTIIPKKNNNPESPKRAGSRFTYGPFDEVSAGAFEPVKVRYQFNKPLIHVSKLERDVEISHWGGNAAFEERYTLINRAANLSKLFSRVEWANTNYYSAQTTAIKELKVPLRAGCKSPYFVDIIGNVSTSRFRNNKHEASLEIKPRYPVFGGWKYPFRIGWDLELKKYLRKLEPGDGFVLNVPFLEGPHQAEGIEYELVQLRIILPEGAKDLKYSTAIPIVSANISLYKTFMDTIGRTTLTLTAVNLFDDLRDKELIVTYNYSPIAALRKPVVYFSGILGLFTAAWVAGRLDINISGKVSG